MCSPWMVEAVINGVSFLDIYSEHAIDKIKSWVTDRIPVRRWVVEAASLDLLSERVWVLTSVKLVREGGETTQADIQDDT